MIKRFTPELLNSNIRLNILGYLNRKDLAELYSRHQIILIPSLAEGSARVGFEALSSGCFVITTDYTGTIVKDSINALIVEPGNSKSLNKALKNALDYTQNELGEIMFNNFIYTRENYAPNEYARRVVQYYEEL